MADEIKVKRINIKEYDISRWEALLDQVYPVVAHIFDIKREQLARSIFHQNTTNTNLYLFYHGRDNIVGINLVNIYEYNYKGDDYSFFRFLSGILPAYRGKSNVQKVGFVEAFKYAALNPMRKIYYLGPFIHPSSYAAACKVSSHVYPSLKHPNAGRYMDLMVTVADILGMERVEGQSPLIRKMPLKTIEQEGDVPTRISKRAQFFMDINPNYKEGYGLITLAPMNLKDVTASFMRFYTRAK